MAWSWYSVLITFASLGGVVTGGVLFALYWFQDNLLYFPSMPEGSRIIFEDPREYKMEPFEEVFFPSRGDNVKIQGWLFLRSPKFPTIMYFCGNAGNIGHRLPHVQGIWERSEVNFFLVSYRGYGKSEGIPSEAGIKRDGEGALDYLYSRGLGERGVILFGESLGGAVSVYLASHHPEKVRGLILLNTFTSIDDMIAVIFPILNRAKALSRNKWSSADYIGAVKCPILFLSGSRDELVPPAQMKKLHDLATNSSSKKLELFATGQHNSTWCCSGYYDVVTRWLREQKLSGEAAKL